MPASENIGTVAMAAEPGMTPRAVGGGTDYCNVTQHWVYTKMHHGCFTRKFNF